jgi:large subunit ribosomal protein L4e
MKLKILDAKNTEKGSKDLPKVFSEEFRPDLIKRAVEAMQSNRRQPYGASPDAGKRASAELSRRRRKYRGSYGHGISRVPRKIMSRRGSRLNWVGAFAPGTVGGRRAHAPKATKIWTKKINVKERRKAIRSAIAATMIKETVQERGHVAPASYPFIITNDFEKLSKTKDVEGALTSLGFKDELSRASEKTFRAGKARLRGRKYRKRKGPLFVVGADCILLKAAPNVAGVEVVRVDNLNAELLAPGTNPGRITLFTESAIERLGKENLFYENVKKEIVKQEIIGKNNKKPTKSRRPSKKAESNKK